MCPLNEAGQFDDVVEGPHQHQVVSVGTTAVEAKGGASRLAGRQILYLYNDSNTTIYWGSASVTATGATKGIPLVKGQFASLPFGELAPVYLIAASEGNDVIVGEVS